MIENISSEHAEKQLEIEIMFTTIYAAMVAEENKAFTKLGKRVKRLGLYQALLESQPVGYVASFSKGKKCREIDKECIKRGF